MQEICASGRAKADRSAGAPEGGPSCWRWPPLQLLRIL